jgi:hypothetical protein
MGFNWQGIYEIAAILPLLTDRKVGVKQVVDYAGKLHGTVFCDDKPTSPTVKGTKIPTFLAKKV